ncbi:sugar transferase [Botrimarina sp.]|uniref:sugar transferase n=1 Tax=Botrimarina sp. TaxID=2795802 RepID=UPI0032F008D2
MLGFVRPLIGRSASAPRRAPEEPFFLSAKQFELAATGERMRVDRNGSVLSLLVIRLSPSKSSNADVRDLEARLAARLRLTDTAGWLRDGRLGLLLPDTPESGAWKVAADICDAYDAGADRPDCEVVLYPEGGRRRRPEASDQPAGETPTVAGRPAHADSAAEALAPHDDRAVVDGAPGAALDAVLAAPLPAWKRAFDIVGASIGLVVAAPVIVAAAVAVRLTSPGPSLFVQEREGLGGKRFRIYKLRTMRTDAERLKRQLRALNEQDGPAFKIADDPRVTPFGRLLRRTSLDELPQLWNVLRGDMSLVGPRPLPIDESLACQPWQRRRLHVTPGLTCTWQVYGRNVVPFDEWIRMDLDYARRRSPWLDLVLVARTCPSLLRLNGR